MDDTLRRGVARSVAWLNEHNGTDQAELTLRILKVTEEAGEAAGAWIGTIGQNPRKGVTHTRRDVADELADVALTALVAIGSLGFDPAEVLGECLAKVGARLDADVAPATPEEQTGRPGSCRTV